MVPCWIPPTADVTARCVGMLAQLDAEKYAEPIRNGVAFLKSEQEEDGSWFGRWGTNYVYGTWSVLCALNAAGEDTKAPYIQRAVQWLRDRQSDDGGWGEDGATYWEEERETVKASTASQTAWAVLALMAVGETESEAVERGIKYLLEAPRDSLNWEEPWYTAVGFPKVFLPRNRTATAFISRFGHLPGSEFEEREHRPRSLRHLNRIGFCHGHAV